MGVQFSAGGGAGASNEGISSIRRSRSLERWRRRYCSMTCKRGCTVDGSPAVACPNSKDNACSGTSAETLDPWAVA
jgi:hypothetical protein